MDELRTSHQGSHAEVTVVLQFNQGERKKRAVYPFFLDFFCYFLCQDKKVN
jgi:hypothetical protein